MSLPLNPQENLRSGIQAFQRREYARAYEILSDMTHPTALNIAGISAQRLGQNAQAEACFSGAHSRAPGDAEILNNWGHFERSRNEFERAREKFTKALGLNNALTAARFGLASVHAACQEWELAKVEWERVLQKTPDSRAAIYGYGTALLELGYVEAALGQFKALDNTEPKSPEVAFMLGRTYLLLGEFGEAEDALIYAHTRQPSSFTLRTLAGLYWMSDRITRYEEILRNAPDSLIGVRLHLLLDAGQTTQAQQLWSNKRHLLEDTVDGQLLRCLIAKRMGQIDVALTAAQDALEIDGTHMTARDALISGYLMSGQPDTALELLQPLRQTYPQAQNWIAHEGVGARMAGHPTPEHYVRTYTIPVPEGFDTLEAFNRDFAHFLKTYQQFERRPLEQSLRGGTQAIRGLLKIDHPIVKAYIKALDTPIRAYMQELGRDQTHPASARNTGKYHFSGMWSVHLRGKGYHESHFHPQGWISSAYYVQVPDSKDGSRAGWLHCGVPPYQTALPVEPIQEIKPEPGKLVLFPSYMWHGTYPTDEGVDRITAPFDILPS